MEKEKITPEEQLLKVIENPELVQKRKVTKEEVVNKAGRLFTQLKGLRFDKNTLKKIDVQIVNKIIAVLCILITVVLVYDLVNAKIKFAKRFENITAEPSEAVTAKAAAMDIDVKISDVLAQAHKHNIFTLLPPKEKQVQRTDIGGPVELRLVGVLWSDNPQAMIENTKEQKTYFVNTGDKIGVVTVKSITQNKVIISKDSEEWELR